MMQEMDKYVGIIFAIAVFVLIMKHQSDFNSLLGGTLTNATGFVKSLANSY